MPNINTNPKEKRFFEYLLELTNLRSKVIRDYRSFEKHWNFNELKEIEGCYVYDDCEDKDTYLEIHRPQIENHKEFHQSLLVI